MDEAKETGAVPVGKSDKKYCLIIFCVGVVFFAFVSWLGWGKLKYGFNFIDEGMYMTDGWRLTVGDSLIPDSSVNIMWMYSSFNAVIFKLFPDVTLLEFRKIQFVFTILSLLIFCHAVYLYTKEYYYLPFVVSIFAFTGLEPNGLSSNLSYYSYSHLFLIMYLSSLLYGLRVKLPIVRVCFMMIAGLFLWSIGFCFLPLTIFMISPIILWLLSRKNIIKDELVTFKDAVFVFITCILLWLIFLFYYKIEFVNTIFFIKKALVEKQYDKSIDTYLVNILHFLKYSFTASLLCLPIVFCKKLRTSIMIPAILISSSLLFSVVYTNLYGNIEGHWRGWFNDQLWFSSLLIFSMAFYSVKLLIKWKTDKLYYNNDDNLIDIVAVTCVLYVIIFGYYSSMQYLTAAYASIPLTIAISVYVINTYRKSEKSKITAMVPLVALLFPFYYNLAMADWQFTYFDMPPKELTYTIEDGFAKGIRTNQVYYETVKWMTRMSEKYSQKDDFSIMYDRVPMGHMITKRRPALNHSWVDLGESNTLKTESIKQTLAQKREPKIAFHFVSAPLFLPTSIKDGTFLYPILIPPKNNSISEYVTKNMKLAETLTLNNQPFLDFYIDDKLQKTIN